MSVADVILMISVDEELSEQFCKLDDLEKVKEFIRKFDRNISDGEIVAGNPAKAIKK